MVCYLVWGQSQVDCKTISSCNHTVILITDLSRNLTGIKKIENSALNIFVCATGGSLEEKVQAKMRSLKSRASGLLKLNRAESICKEKVLEDDPVLSIPLSSLVKVGTRSPQVSGCFYVNATEMPGSAIVGEMAIHVVASPDAFIIPAVEEPIMAVNHQQYLTLLESRLWRRSYAVLEDRRLQIRDFQRHEVEPTSTLALNSVVEIKFVPEHPCGVDNVLSLAFEDGNELLAYADDQDQGLEWTDKIHRAVWNQPYVH